MGPKLGIYLKNYPREISKGDLVEVTFYKDDKNYLYLTKFNTLLNLRTEVIDYLSFRKGEKISLSIKKLKSLARTQKLFREGKIDLLHLVPQESSNGYPIVVKSIRQDDEEKIVLWCFHNRGSCMQIELRRFIDIDSFGRFLGLMQSEGNKNNFKNVEFANASLKEHKDFVRYLHLLGINSELINVDCIHTSQREKAKDAISSYEKKVGIAVKNVYSSDNNKYGLGFKLKIRNVIFANIVMFSMDKIRKLITERKWNRNLTLLAEAYFAKLLSGDGNVDLAFKNRRLPQGRIKITDGNLDYLQDYQILMKRFGFNPRLLEKHIIVRSYFKLDQAKWLLKIKAFENNPNSKKLQTFINARTK
ncbi:hypothetical protein CO038_04115 [Candidatus Pacearchaeota archaeon CG_4_9_14_0_2_um_filter_39_13]|nr:hypothetical protein [Candidatus Pacearchaeota archaeon]OIO44079.1 MAG: hypothetical protein AUJ64_00470 [Candidatus Pacearchaeota archaeon CG1_02_39_14]PJC44369.1 MAG: hypothetical protein CO038_04115 [Candidatus Pacearchaeota archaeon CG_4_9_14_0_2_um_filter_39_13]